MSHSMHDWSTFLDTSKISKISPYIAGALASTLVFMALRINSVQRRARLPPGPKPLPLIGNLLDIPRSEEWLTWQSYVEHYGDLVFLSALGNNFLILGSHQVIAELLEKRVNFNSRGHTTMLNELAAFDWGMKTLPYGERWRRDRKLLHAHTHAGVSMQYAPVQIRMARRFVCDLLASETSRPEDRFSDSAKAILPYMVRRSFGMTIVSMTYGIDIQDSIMEAEYVGIAERVIRMLAECATPGRFLVDFFPWMKYTPAWLPGAQFKRFASEGQRLVNHLRDSPFEVTKAQMAAGNAPASMVARMLESNPRAEEQIKDVVGFVYLAGSDTTVGAVTSYFLAALVYPDVQRNAQVELDRVIGRHRLPEFADKDNLPYLDVIMRECLRWLPLVPIGVPHATTEDDEYRGYFIPKGTLVLPFQWGLLHDPDVYPEPSTFAPERYLNRLPDGTWELRVDVTDPRTFAFGFGRRVCPGTHIAEQSLFATLATVLHTLDVIRTKDGEGREVVPEVRVSSGILSHAYPFPYELRMRADAGELVDMCTVSTEL